MNGNRGLSGPLFCYYIKDTGGSYETGQIFKSFTSDQRRTVANEACDAGRVTVNGKPAKASTKVKKGDVIEIQFGTKAVKAEVLDIQDTTKKEEAKELFRYI